MSSRELAAGDSTLLISVSLTNGDNFSYCESIDNCFDNRLSKSAGFIFYRVNKESWGLDKRSKLKTSLCAPEKFDEIF